MDQQHRTDVNDQGNMESTQAENVQASGSAGAEQASPTNNKSGKTQKEVFEWVKALAIAALLVLVIRYFLFAPFIVDGPSMQPTFYTGERLIVNKIIYDIRQPKRGEVVVFHVPEEGRDFIKRVIGVPGDKVKYEGDNLYINGKKVDEPYLKQSIAEAKANGQIFNNNGPDKDFPNENFKTDIVPAGSILAFGDNRRDSKDSRMIGFVPMSRIVGRADIIFWPVSKIEFVKHG
ncbi:signal peptidase I [Paenibacillus baekrokdamisoli]|uniref:Signal peptidase I n=1 Tax=Paenibacillus baekrokdamisoli TaxID=1712516 RepID=A0A3G9IR76_9BACL|nr:signal peptidase I [Paenibacillus baekrokdamisoli]MBB3069750.1 signal peptidase I [Paenibacillus baekrokdamisoli]BBH20896.1 signal peptidase I [Paenibacillus baekrokdamisoli]